MISNAASKYLMFSYCRAIQEFLDIFSKSFGKELQVAPECGKVFVDKLVDKAGCVQGGGIHTAAKRPRTGLPACWWRCCTRVLAKFDAASATQPQTSSLSWKLSSAWMLRYTILHRSVVCCS